MNLVKKLIAFALAAVLLTGIAPVASAVQQADEFSEIRMTARTDYSNLELKIATVNGLKAYDYTKQSWSKVDEAVKYGERILKGKYGQNVVDGAVEDIQQALSGLVKMDYSQLEVAMAAVYTKIDEDPELHDVWSRVDAAMMEARPLLSSGNQEGVDAMVERLNALMEELSACKATAAEPEVVIQEVEVEVLPTGDFCNIPNHRLWPMLLAVSGVLNVALVVLLVYVILKKRNTIDNTPLISYDIDDDMDF